MAAMNEKMENGEDAKTAGTGHCLLYSMGEFESIGEHSLEFNNKLGKKVILEIVRKTPDCKMEECKAMVVDARKSAMAARMKNSMVVKKQNSLKQATVFFLLWVILSQ